MKLLKSLLFSGCVLGGPALLLADEGIEPVLVHPFEDVFSLGNRSIKASLQQGAEDELNLQARSRKMIDSWGINARIAPKTKSFTGFNLYNDTRIQTVEMGFQVDGVPLCQFQLKFHETLKGGMAVFGNLPRIDVQREFSASDWPEEAYFGPRIVETLSMKGLDPDFKILQKTPCLWTHEGSLYPVWELEFTSGDLLYAAIVDDQTVHRFHPKHFHATGKAKTYPNNIKDPERQEFTINEMTGSGYLENAYFTTCVPSGPSVYVCPPTAFAGPPYPLVKEASLNYDYTLAGNGDALTQTSVFVNANRTLEWLKEHGYKSFGNVPIRLHVHAVFQGDSNNALYEPRPGFSIIYVGDGDGDILQNLGTDADVVGHELGHHVVYDTIKRIDKREPLVLHEGLADYLTFARTGNACLGESICPDSSVQTRVCTIAKRCLRSGENDYTFGGATTPKEPHTQSQFISGMLWDLYAKDKIPLNDVTRLVLRTLELMVEDSGFVHWSVGMLLADDAFFQGTNCNTILNRLKTRGLSAAVTDIDCQKIQTQTVISEGSNSSIRDYLVTDTTAATSQSSGSKSGKKSCGVISPGVVHGHDLSHLLLWFLPLAAAVIRRFRG